jgi:hypothetical protein
VRAVPVTLREKRDKVIARFSFDFESEFHFVLIAYKNFDLRLKRMKYICPLARLAMYG